MPRITVPDLSSDALNRGLNNADARAAMLDAQNKALLAGTFQYPRGAGSSGGGAGIRPESVVRPAQSWQDRYDQRIAELAAAPAGTESEEDPELCIGGPDAESGLDGDPANQEDLGGGGFNTKQPDQEEQPKEPPIYEWREKKEKRKTKKIRVENPEDSEQYVIIERIESMVMTAPSPEPFNGKEHTWFFKNK